MNLKKKLSIIASVSTLLVIFSLLLAYSVPAHPRYGPYVDTHYWSMIIGPDAQLTALLQHAVQAGGVPRPEDIPEIEAAGFTINTMVRLGYNMLFQCNVQYPCDDINFRRAVNRLVDKAALTELLAPIQSPMTYWLPPSMGEWVADGGADPGYPASSDNPANFRPNYPLPVFNPGMPLDSATGSAYSYLNDNGYTMTDTPNPWYDAETSPDWASQYLRSATGDNVVMPEFEYTTRSPTESPLYYEHSLIICNGLHQAGINAMLVPKTWLEIVAILTNSDPVDYCLMTGVGIVWSAPEPDIQYDFFQSEQFPLWNVWVYSDPAMDAACAELKGTLNYTKLKQACMLTQNITKRDEPMLPVMMYNTFTVFEGPTRTNCPPDPTSPITWNPELPYDPGTNRPGCIGIVNDICSGAVASYNEWGKLIGDGGRTMSPENINVWYLGGYLDTLNPLLADTVPDWQVLELVCGEGGMLNPYTAAYMPWALAKEPEQKPWIGPGDNAEYDATYERVEDPEAPGGERFYYDGEEITEDTVPQGDDAKGAFMWFEMRQGLKWHDGVPITAEDPVFGLDLNRFQEVARYRSTWEPIYDVVLTGTYTWKAYYQLRYYFAARAVGGLGYLTPKHIWEGFIQPTIDPGAGPCDGDVWTASVGDHTQWYGWENDRGADTYNDYPELRLTDLIGFGPYVYHLGGWVPGIESHVEANPYYMATSDPIRWCQGDVNKDHYTDGRDVWHIQKRFGQEEYMPVWYMPLGRDPPVEATAVDITWPAQVIDMAEQGDMQLHTGHWSGIGDSPEGWLKEPAG